ncbi:MAG: RluA family pseudouridine synthase, partial [Proteobacteria bacterium]|nr:RluA family pseudouridine synthase [Pseudomonadota bacterium]
MPICITMSGGESTIAGSLPAGRLDKALAEASGLSR